MSNFSCIFGKTYFFVVVVGAAGFATGAGVVDLRLK